MWLRPRWKWVLCRFKVDWIQLRWIRRNRLLVIAHYWPDAGGANAMILLMILSDSSVVRAPQSDILEWEHTRRLVVCNSISIPVIGHDCLPHCSTLFGCRFALFGLDMNVCFICLIVMVRLLVVIPMKMIIIIIQIINTKLTIVKREMINEIYGLRCI